MGLGQRGERKAPRAILELSDFAGVFGVILTDESTDESWGTETSHVSPTMDLRVLPDETERERERESPTPQPTAN